MAFINASKLLFEILHPFIFIIAFLCHFVDELKGIEQDIFFSLAELPVSFNVRLGFLRNMRDLAKVNLLLQALQTLGQTGPTSLEH